MRVGRPPILFEEIVMNSRFTGALNICRIAIFSSIVLGLLAFLVPGTAVAAEFKGSEACKGCHEKNYRDWKASGHPYKLVKAEEAQFRSIPTPMGFDWITDISYVIGGDKWKSRYIDERGYIITVTKDEDGNLRDGVNQYNMFTGEWVDYHAGEVDKPYNCGTCHTTNWVADEDHDTDNDLTDNQDGLPGMHGTFDAGGIHCEQCHGNGFGFIAGETEGMQVDDSAEACGSCHNRNPPGSGIDKIPASSGFIKHHEQWNEHEASPHASFKCVDCHNPHERGPFSIWEDGESDDYPFGLSTGAECGVNCHKAIGDSYAQTAMADYDVECKDCHMPYATKSANQLGPFQGDVQTHILYISTDADYNMFSEDGSEVALDMDGKAKVSLDFACKRCHTTTDMEELARFAKNFHEPNLSEIGFNPGLTGYWNGGPERDGEGWQIEVGSSNGELVVVIMGYVYNNLGDQMFVVASKAISGTDTTIVLDAYTTAGGGWGVAFDPSTVVRSDFGQLTLTMPTCGSGSVAIVPNADRQAEGFGDFTGDIFRDNIVGTEIQCPSFVNDPN